MRIQSKLAAVAGMLWLTTAGAATLQGQVVDTNGQPVAQAQVILEREAGAAGAAVINVFTSQTGQFRFPEALPELKRDQLQLRARALGYRPVDQSVRVSGAAGAEAISATLIVAKTDNQIDVAPASAWLNRITSRTEKSAFVMNCIDCHQVPASEQRAYAASISDLHAPDPALARTESWKSIVKYMNYLTQWEFSRGRRQDDQKLDSEAVYAVENGDDVVKAMTKYFPDRLDHIAGYSWGAPLIATGNTAIWEYAVPHPNAIREALMLGEPRQLWVADVAANRIVAVDVATGTQKNHEVPSDVLMSPHSLHKGKDGSLWVTPLFNSVVAHLDIATGKWRTWRLRTPDGKSPGIHDLSFGWEHELLTDERGRIWYSDIGNNAVGYLDPQDGSARVWGAPPSPGRAGRTALYGLSMTKNRKEVWYSQLGNGTFGGFDIDKQQFIGPFQLPDRNAGPRRIAISDDDVLYMALYGGGQLAEFDTKTRRMIGVYDLPDTGSAPYATTWDPRRKVVWIATANGDVIYRFDPQTKQFGVLPLPREQAFLRMIDVDPETGVLVTSYANIVDIVQGPRMALVIDPGDGVYPGKFLPSGSKPAEGLLAAVALPATAAETDGAKLFEQKRCYTCHDQNKVSLGPPLAAIAARHAAQRDVMVDVLARKIVDGGGGNWGLVPMVPNQWVSLAEARVLSEWILGPGARK